MKRHQLRSSTLVGLLSLACLLGTMGCKTFNSTEEDVEHERRYARDGYNSFWMRGLSMFGFPSCYSGSSGIAGSGSDLFPAASGPANARPWLSNASEAGILRSPQVGR